MASVKIRPSLINLYESSPTFTTSIPEGKGSYKEAPMYTLFKLDAFNSIPDGSTINNIWFTFKAYCTSGESSIWYDHKALWKLSKWIRTDNWDGSYPNFNGWYSNNHENFVTLYEYSKQGTMEVQISATDSPGSDYTMGNKDGKTSDLLGSASISLSDLKAGVYLNFLARRKGVGSVTMGMSEFYMNIDYTPPSYYLDLNGKLDNNSDNGSISGWGTADVYINKELVSSGVDDYYVSHYSGTEWEIKNIIAKQGYRYIGQSSYSGVLTSNTTIVLQFETKVSCTVSFNGNGGTGSTNSVSGYVGDSITLPHSQFSRTYTVTLNPNYSGAAISTDTSQASFSGWYADSSLTTFVGRAGGSYAPTTSSVTLYAGWGSGNDEIYLANLTRTDYKFLGWYTESAGGERIESDDVYYPPGDITLYAHWQALNGFFVGNKRPKFYSGTSKMKAIFAGDKMIYHDEEVAPMVTAKFYDADAETLITSYQIPKGMGASFLAEKIQDKVTMIKPNKYFHYFITAWCPLNNKAIDTETIKSITEDTSFSPSISSFQHEWVEASDGKSKKCSICGYTTDIN